MGLEFGEGSAAPHCMDWVTRCSGNPEGPSWLCSHAWPLDGSRWLNTGLNWAPPSVLPLPLHVVPPAGQLNFFTWWLRAPRVNIAKTRSGSCLCLKVWPSSFHSIISTTSIGWCGQGQPKVHLLLTWAAGCSPEKLHIPTKWTLWNKWDSDLSRVLKAAWSAFSSYSSSQKCSLLPRILNLVVSLQRSHLI